MFTILNFINIAANGIDFAVVCQKTKGLGQRPGRHGVGTVSLMHHDNGRFKIGMRQIRVKIFKLQRNKHAFVNKGSSRKRGNVKIVHSPTGLRCFLFNDFAQDVKFTFQRILRQIFKPHKHLPKGRHGFPGQATQSFRIDGHFAPT